MAELDENPRFARILHLLDAKEDQRVSPWMCRLQHRERIQKGRLRGAAVERSNLPRRGRGRAGFIQVFPSYPRAIDILLNIINNKINNKKYHDYSV
jgi:hypothetical protein